MFINQNHKRNTLVVGALLMSLFVLSSPANAVDRKINSATVCQPNSGAQVSDFTYYSTGITNNATADRWVSCPVVRDNTFNTNGLNLASVSVAGTGSFFCYLDNVNNNGSLGVWASTGTVTGPGTFPINLNSSTSQTPYVFLCRIPTNGKLVTLMIDEYLSTNNQ